MAFTLSPCNPAAGAVYVHICTILCVCSGCFGRLVAADGKYLKKVENFHSMVHRAQPVRQSWSDETKSELRFFLQLSCTHLAWCFDHERNIHSL